MAGRTRVPGDVVRRRAEDLAPLVGYCQRHAIGLLVLARRCAMRRGEVMTRGRLHQMKRGLCLTPDWFVADVCREIGRPVDEVMGADWVREHGHTQPAEKAS